MTDSDDKNAEAPAAAKRQKAETDAGLFPFPFDELVRSRAHPSSCSGVLRCLFFLLDAASVPEWSKYNVEPADSGMAVRVFGVCLHDADHH